MITEFDYEQLLKKNKALTAELKAAKKEIKIDEVKTDLDFALLVAQIKTLKDALKKYGRHKDHCYIVREKLRKCTCGFEQASKKAMVSDGTNARYI